MAKPGSEGYTAKFVTVGQSSGYNDIVGVNNLPGQVTENPGDTATFNFTAADAASHYAYLNNDPMQNLTEVRYYADVDHNGVITATDTLVYDGAPSGFDFQDLINASNQTGASTFLAAFDDSYGGHPDYDYNDINVAITLSQNGKPIHPNAGRGNGSEIGFDPNHNPIELDPGNSAAHNHGGDFLF